MNWILSDLSNDVDKAKELAEEELHGVRTVALQRLLEVLLDELDPVRSVPFIDDHHGVGEVADEHLHEPALTVLPDHPGKVEAGRLEEQYKDDPLIVFVMNHLLISFWWSDSRVRLVLADFFRRPNGSICDEPPPHQFLVERLQGEA